MAKIRWVYILYMCPKLFFYFVHCQTMFPSNQQVYESVVITCYSLQFLSILICTFQMSLDIYSPFHHKGMFSVCEQF